MPTHIDTNFDIYKPPTFICFHIPHVTFHDTINVQALLPFHITKPSFYMCVCVYKPSICGLWNFFYGSLLQLPYVDMYLSKISKHQTQRIQLPYVLQCEVLTFPMWKEH